MSIRSLIVLLFASLFVSGNLLAAGGSSSSSGGRSEDSYSRAVKAVKTENYNRALRLLDKVVAKSPGNADAWNYMGFSHRKLKHFDQALSAYKKALAIDPNHIGANEYLGELYVQTGKIDQARSRLGKLKELCGTSCDEYRDLNAAIETGRAG